MCNGVREALLPRMIATTHWRNLNATKWCSRIIEREAPFLFLKQWETLLWWQSGAQTGSGQLLAFWRSIWLCCHTGFILWWVFNWWYLPFAISYTSALLELVLVLVFWVPRITYLWDTDTSVLYCINGMVASVYLRKSTKIFPDKYAWSHLYRHTHLICGLDPSQQQLVQSQDVIITARAMVSPHMMLQNLQTEELDVWISKYIRT